MTLSGEPLRRSAEYKRAIPQMILSGLEESVENFYKPPLAVGVPKHSAHFGSRALEFALVVSGGDLESTVTAFMRLGDLDGWESEERRDAISMAQNWTRSRNFMSPGSIPLYVGSWGSLSAV